MAYEKQFAALAHPLRQDILQCLGDAPHSVGDLARRFGTTQPAMSQHLKTLRDAGFVQVRPEGTRNIYVLQPDGLQALRHYLEDHWRNVLQALDKEED